MPNNEHSEAPEKRVQSRPFTRAVKILISLNHGENRLSDICSSTGLNIGTVHRLLKTLKDSGFVVQNPINRQYYLGHVFIRLAYNTAHAHQNLVAMTFDEMRYLRELTGETVNLSVPFGTERVILVELPSRHAIRFALGAGHAAPLHSSAGGRILLAGFPEREREVLLENMELTRLAPGTITNKDVLIRELENIQKQGYATSFSGVIQGTASVAVPIKNYVIPVSVSIYGPEDRFTNIINHLKELKESADRISDKLLSFGEQASEGKSPFLEIQSKKSKRQRGKNR